MNTVRSIISGVILSLAAVNTSAQVAGPSCTEPAKPAELKTQQQINNWARVVEQYQRCLMDYSARQKILSDQYAKAANDAVARWNAFVQRMNTASRQ